MKEVNGFKVYEGSDICALDEYSEQMANDLGTKFNEISKEQTTQNNKLNSIETKNINQDNLIQQLQQENTLLKSQIPTGTASGEEITLTDSSNMPFNEFIVHGKSVQDGEPTPDTPIAIRNVGDDGSVEIEKCNKNLLPTDISRYNISLGLYGHIKLINSFTKPYLVASLIDNDTSVDMTGISFGFTNNGIDAIGGSSWFYTNNVESSDIYKSTDSYKYFSFYPNNEETLNKIFSRYKIQIEFSDTTVATDYTPHQSETFIFPLAEGQVLHEGDYLAEDGIHSNRTTLVFNGTEFWRKDNDRDDYGVDYFYTYITGIDKNNIDTVMCSHFIKGDALIEGFWATAVFCITIPKTQTGIVSTDTTLQRIEKFKTWLAEQYANGTPVTLEYELAEEIVTPYTEAQKEVRGKIQNSHTYKNITHISAKGDIKPILEIEYYKDLETIQKQNDENYDKLANAIVALGGVI